MKFADLHLHTAFSDGTYTPEELVKASKKASLSAIAITDHDTVAGIDQGISFGQAEDLEIIPGIELSAEYNGREVHILGYFVDHKNPEFLLRLDFLKQNRIERVAKIVEKLNALGLALKSEDVFDVSKGATVSRLHVARALVARGFVSSTQESFQKYLGDNCPGYVLGFKFHPQDVIKLIRDSGGIPVLAHPYTLGDDKIIAEFVEYGLMGLEVYYPEHSNTRIKSYLAMVQEYNLLATGGSDFHGNAKPDVHIGTSRIPYYLVEDLKDARKRVK